MGLAGGLAANGQQGGGGGGAGAVTVQGSVGTNLGATQTIDFASKIGEIWLVGTLNVNLTVTVSNRVAGCRAMLLLTQDGTGGRSLTVSDGAGSVNVTIAVGASQFSMIEIKLPDASAVNIAAVGGGGSQTARDSMRMAAIGLTGQNFEILAAPTSVVPGTQTVIYTLGGLLAGDVVNNIYVDLAQIGVGAAPTSIFLGLYTKAGVLVASTANLAADAKWTTVIKIVGFAVTAPYTVPSSDGYYFAILKNGVFATTDIKVRSITTQADVTANSPSGVNIAASQAGQTVLPASATFALSLNPIWFGFN